MPQPSYPHAVYGTRGGQYWTATEAGVWQLVNGNWMLHHDASWPRYIISAVPVDESRLLILGPAQVLEFNADSDVTTTVLSPEATGLGWFKQLSPARDGSVWVAGEKGFGMYCPTEECGGKWRVVLSDRSGYHSFSNIHEGDGGEIFFSGVSTGSGKPTASMLKDGVVHVIASTDKDAIEAWGGTEGSLWVREKDDLYRIVNGRKDDVEKQGVLSGVLHDVIPQPGGVFWICTSQGVARYAPPLWRVPPEISALKTSVHGAIEDSLHRIWFDFNDRIVRFDGRSWKTYLLPGGQRTNP
jgi:ligand-binding sensor domain-containing protein